jgi:AcrR family transcriptional regulator
MARTRRLDGRGVAEGTEKAAFLHACTLRSIRSEMSRPQSITDDEILAAARAVFLDKGITATVEEVAARCRVGEATVFRRFPTKQALFLAAMNTASEPAWLQTIKERAVGTDIRCTLTDLAHDILTFGRKMIPLILMKMSNPGITDRGPPPARLLRTIQGLTEFFEIEIKAGRINARDARVAARIWIGALQHFVMFEVFTKSVDTLSADIFVQGLVDMFAPTARPKGRRG